MTKLNENANLLVGCSNIKVRNVNLLKDIEDLSEELKSLEENKNNSSLSQSNFKKINKSNKSASAKNIFPPIRSISTIRSKGK